MRARTGSVYFVTGRRGVGGGGGLGVLCPVNPCGYIKAGGGGGALSQWHNEQMET